jgi:hypothetical protein
MTRSRPTHARHTEKTHETHHEITETHANTRNFFLPPRVRVPTAYFHCYLMLEAFIRRSTIENRKSEITSPPSRPFVRMPELLRFHFLRSLVFSQQASKSEIVFEKFPRLLAEPSKEDLFAGGLTPNSIVESEIRDQKSEIRPQFASAKISRGCSNLLVGNRGVQFTVFRGCSPTQSFPVRNSAFEIIPVVHACSRYFTLFHAIFIGGERYRFRLVRSGIEHPI